MADALEMMLKDAIKKIVTEAIAETMSERMVPAGAGRIGVPSSAIASAPVQACTDMSRRGVVKWERLTIALKSLGLGAFALAACGLCSTVLFPPDFAQAANDVLYYESRHADDWDRADMDNANWRPGDGPDHDGQHWDGHHHHHHHMPTNFDDMYDDEDRAAVEACMEENGEPLPQHLTWKDLFNFNKIHTMIKRDVFLHAGADDLTAIVLFYELRKMIRGEPITLRDLPNDFKNALPCKWRPVFNAVTAGVPEPVPLAPLPPDFIPPPNFW